MHRISHYRIPASAAEIGDEPMIFSGSFRFAMDNGGPLTRKALSAIRLHARAWSPSSDVELDSLVIDTRVHMLKPGWVPAIPGWHCDAVPRGADGQPDLNHPQVDKITHFLCVIDAGTGALTEFFDASDFHFGSTPNGENVWGHHSRMINLATAEWADKRVTKVESGEIYQFSARDYHRAVPATGDGWRFFLRASANTLTRGPFNEIRKQVQVYIPDEDMGW